MQNLQQQLERRNEDHDRLMTLFNAFQHGSDDLAANLLARLRLGESVETLVSLLEEGKRRMSQTQPSESEKRGTYPFGNAEVPSDTVISDLDPELLEGQVERSLTLERNFT